MEQLWSLAFLMLVLAPVIAALAYGIRHRDSGAPTGDQTIESDANIAELRNTRDMRTRDRGF